MYTSSTDVDKICQNQKKIQINTVLNVFDLS